MEYFVSTISFPSSLKHFVASSDSASILTLCAIEVQPNSTESINAKKFT